VNGFRKREPPLNGTSGPRARTPSTEVVLGIDVGGTSIKVSLIDRAGRLRAGRRVATRRAAGSDAVVDQILETAALRVERHEPVPGRPRARATIVAIGLVVPGLVDEERGMAVRSVNLGWTNVPLGRRLEERTGLPVALGHDVRSAAMAEHVVGAAVETSDFLFIALGAGVGGAVMLGDNAYRGAHERGGEFGHMSVDRKGPRCTCGARGCVEAFASGSSIGRRYAKLSKRDAAVGSREIGLRVTRGDPLAERVWREAVGALSMGIANYVTLLDPERVVVGGGVSNAGERLLFGPLRREVAGLMPQFASAPPIVRAALGAHAGCVGAGILAWSRLGVRVSSAASGGGAKSGRVGA
jgi:glucokinase